jgi:threonine synthase
LALEEELANDPGATGVFLATAHPSKFREVVEPAIGQAVPLPQPLAEALTRPRHSIEMAADYGALREFLAS